MTNPFTAFDPPLAGPPVLAPTDVSYTIEDSPVGRLLLAVTAEGTVVTCAYAPDTAAEDRWLSRLASAVSPRVLRHPAPTDAVRRALAAYLAGTVRSVDVRPDLALASPFQREVLTGLATGASLTGVMSSSKVSEIDSAPSLAVTLSWSAPLESCGGVPEKVPVEALKLSQVGRSVPSPSVADRVSEALSTSAKVPAGTTKL